MNIRNNNIFRQKPEYKNVRKYCQKYLDYIQKRKNYFQDRNHVQIVYKITQTGMDYTFNPEKKRFGMIANVTLIDQSSNEAIIGNETAFNNEEIRYHKASFKFSMFFLKKI